MLEWTPKDVLTAFDTGYRARFQTPAPIVGGKDAKLAKALLGRYTPAQLEGLMATFFRMRDPFIQQSGYTFGVFHACLGKVIVASQRTAPKRLDEDDCEHDLI